MQEGLTYTTKHMTHVTESEMCGKDPAAVKKKHGENELLTESESSESNVIGWFWCWGASLH